MTTNPLDPPVDQMVAELMAAGWTPTPTFWKSPTGTLFLGPYVAWKHMRATEKHPQEKARPNEMHKGTTLAEQLAWDRGWEARSVDVQSQLPLVVADGLSAQLCGCDRRAGWVCEQHRQSQV